MSGCFACLSCIPDTPVDDDPRKDYANKWQVDMGHAPMEEPMYFAFGALCPWCATYMMRERVLQGNMENYQCCQGYFSCMCFQPGVLNENQAPKLCLCLESFCCLSCAVSANRFYIMDHYNLESDPCDNRIIRFNNCLQFLDCIVSIAAAFVEELRDAAQCIDIAAKCVFCTTVACMTAQQHRELNFQEKLGGAGGGHQNGAQAPLHEPEMSRFPDQGQPHYPNVQQQYPGMHQQQAPTGAGNMSRQDQIPEAKPVDYVQTV